LMGQGKTVLVGLPLFHVNAQLGTGLSVWAAGGNVLLATPGGYRTTGLLKSFWQIAERHRITTFSGVPTIFAALLQVPRGKEDLSALAAGVCGAAPMPTEVFARFVEETGIPILEGYGLTEGGCVSSVTPPGSVPRVGSIGLRLPWQQMRVVQLDGQGRFSRFAKANEPGVIAIAGPNVFAGYVRPEHNVGIWIDAPSDDGSIVRWLNTGDLGRQDEDGYFWIAGRAKELIIRGGHNIDPRQIEEVLCSFPGVSLAAAVGRPDPHAGEVPVAYVQVKAGVAVDVDDLVRFTAERVADRAAVPKGIRVLDALPQTAVGKVFKPQLVEREVEDVVRGEAAASEFHLTFLRVIRRADSQLRVEWDGLNDASMFTERLSLYGFTNTRRQPGAGTSESQNP
jgi:acyl-CoA synthetase (AMP-forming)/AMP-acid ligase II